MSAGFEDHFSDDAAAYAAHRPTYPGDLFDFLAAVVPAREVAWDCATGNGQAALALAQHFERVVATDASAQQLAVAPAHERVTYRCEPAAATSLAAASCDLVTVAQAAHWFAGEPFFAEVRRVARPGAVIAVWAYTLLHVAPDVDALIERFEQETVGRFWPPERRFVDAGYATLPFPFPEITVPRWEVECSWSLADLLAYLGTWSAVRRFAGERGFDPRIELEPALRAVWGSGRRSVRWPLVARVGRPTAAG